jgi:HlyD family secretion protein
MRIKKYLYLFLTILILPVQASCSGINIVGTSTSQPEAPTFALESDTVSSSAEVVPAKWINLSFTISGKELQILVEVGDRVEKGQLLAQLDDADAQDRLIEAKESLSEMTSPEAIANAQLAISIADTNQYNAQLSYNNTVNWNDPSRIQDYNADYIIAKDNLDKAQENYNNTRKVGSADTAEEARAYNQLSDAQKAYDIAKGNYDSYSQSPSQRQIDEAKAKLDLAKARLVNAKNYLAAITGGEVPEDASGSELQQFRQAQRNVKEAEKALADTKLYSPFSGSIVEINGHDGENFTPGNPLVVLADFTTLQVLTKDMGEVDTGRIHVGDTAKVSFDALPNIDVTGKVTQIALKNSPGSGVYYTLTISLDTIPEDLRWGMNAFVIINVK